MTGEDIEVLEPSEDEVTVWAPEPTGNDEILNQSVEEWIESVEFESTEDVPIPETLVDQVIGQETGSVVIRKAAEQRRIFYCPEAPSLVEGYPPRKHRHDWD